MTCASARMVMELQMGKKKPPQIIGGREVRNVIQSNDPIGLWANPVV